MITKRKVRKTLIKARNRLEGHWTQGHTSRYPGLLVKNYNDESNVCALGALNWAATGDPDRVTNPDKLCLVNKAVKVLDNCIPVMGGPFRWSGLTTFNDLPTTNEQDVLNLFDCAIKKVF